MLELYHWEPNQAYLKPLIALYEKDLDFTGYYVDVVGFEQFDNGLQTEDIETLLTQEGEAPVLVHDQVKITESFFMLEYLEDTFPETPLRPEDAYIRTQMRSWARLISERFMPAVSTLGCHRYLVPLLKAKGITALPEPLTQHPLRYRPASWLQAVNNDYSADLLEDSHRKISFVVQRIENALGDSRWLVGLDYSLADIDAFAIANCLPTLVPDIVNQTITPHTLDWIACIRERPAVKAALAVSKIDEPEKAFCPGPEHARWG